MSDEENSKYESNNIKIAATAILSVLVGAAFILALIHFGMSVQQNIDSQAEKKQEEEKIVSIINVDYSSAMFGYNVPAGLVTEEEHEKQSKNYLISGIREDYDENYLIIDNKDLLDEALDAIRSSSNNSEISYSVEDNFFSSGSVILITSEKSGLSSLSAKTVTRDENNNIQIDASEEIGQSNLADAVEGRAVFVKIRNIQPNSVKVNIDNGTKKQ